MKVQFVEGEGSERRRQLRQAMQLSELARSGRRLTAQVIADELEVCRRTAYRWIEAAESVQLLEWEFPTTDGVTHRRSNGELRRGPALVEPTTKLLRNPWPGASPR